jgi:hypothetical protein
MGIRVEWDNLEKTIIRHIYEGTWTIDDYYGLIDENYAQIDSVDHRVDIINDLRDMAGTPPNMVPAIRYAARKAHEREGINVMVASTRYVQMLVDAIDRAVGKPTMVIHTRTMEEAREIIAKSRTEQVEP